MAFPPITTYHPSHQTRTSLSALPEWPFSFRFAILASRSRWMHFWGLTFRGRFSLHHGKLGTETQTRTNNTHTHTHTRRGVEWSWSEPTIAMNELRWPDARGFYELSRGGTEVISGRCSDTHGDTLCTLGVFGWARWITARTR